MIVGSIFAAAAVSFVDEGCSFAGNSAVAHCLNAERRPL
jgi:hypothetical protein